MIGVGDRVRAYNSPTDVYEVVETGVGRDVSVDGDEVWRMPHGNTLVRNTRRGGIYLVVSDDLLHEID